MNRIKYLIFSFAIGTITSQAMELSYLFDFQETNQTEASYPEIKEKIKNYGRWEQLFGHLTQLKNSSGLHWYCPESTQKIEGINNNYSVIKIKDADLLVAVPNNCNINNYHAGFIIKRSNNMVDFIYKSFFPCTITQEQIIDIVQNNIQHAQITLILETESVSQYKLFFKHNDVTIKIVATQYKNSSLFFINTLYPEINLSSNDIKDHENNLLNISSKKLFPSINPVVVNKIANAASLYQEALDKDNIKLLEYLLANGVNPDTSLDSYDATPLMIATKKGLYEAVNLLLQAGADIERYDKNRKSVVDYAIECKNYYVLSTIMQLCETGPLLLIKACTGMNEVLFNLLLNCRVDVNIQDKDGNTALHHCAMLVSRDKDLYTQLAKRLLESGADITIENNKKETVGMLANRYYGGNKIKEIINHYLQAKDQFFKEFEQTKKNNPNQQHSNPELLWAIKTNNFYKASDILASCDNGYTVGLAQQFVDKLENEHISSQITNALSTKINEFNENQRAQYDRTVTQIDQKTQKQIKLESTYKAALHKDDISQFSDAELKELKISSKKSLLCQAVKAKKLKAALNLLQRNDISYIWETNHGDGDDKRDALQIAYDNNDKDMLETLLHYEKTTPSTLYAVFINAIRDSNKKNNNNNTSDNLSSFVLTSLCTKSDTEIIKVLNIILEKETEENVNIVLANLEPFYPRQFNKLLDTPYQQNGKTLLMNACQLGKCSVVALLIQKDIFVGAKDQDGATAYDYTDDKAIRALITTKLEQINKNRTPSPQLKETKDNPTLDNAEEKSAHMKSKSKNQKSGPKKKNNNNIVDATDKTQTNKTVKSINSSSVSSYSDTITAIKNGKGIGKIITGYLLKRQQFNPNYADETGTSLLRHALEAKNNIALKSLIAAGADILWKKESTSPLILAFKTKNDECIKLLIPEYHKLNAKNVRTAIIFKKDADNNILLQYAFQRGGDIKDLIVNFILETNKKCDELDSSFFKEFMKMCENKNTAAIAKIIKEQKIDPNFKNDKGKTLLMHTAETGHMDTVEALINSGADINAQNNGITPLMLASYNGNLDVVKKLLQKNANINIKDNNGRTALHWAFENLHYETVKLLLNHKADTGTVGTGKFGQLISATILGDLAKIKSLLEQETDNKLVNEIPEETNLCPLMIAALMGHVEIVKFLLEMGADPNRTNAQKNTPLMFAAKRGNAAIVKNLIEKGADVNAQNTDCKSSLMHAAIAGHLEATNILLKNGANPNGTDNKLLPLLTGIILDPKRSDENYLEIFKSLIKNGADINAPNTEGEVPLMNAVSADNAEIVNLLIELKADINKTNSKGTTPLLFAARKTKLKMVNILLNNGADPNIVDNESFTVLMHVAAQKEEKYCRNC